MTQTSSHTFPLLQTARLRLRPLSDSDEAEIFQLRSDKAVAEEVGRALCTSLEQAGTFIRNIREATSKEDLFYWGVVEEGSDQLIGTVCLFDVENGHGEIGYELLPGQRGKGYMVESVSAVVDFAIEKLQLKSLKAHVAERNRASRNLLEKLRFVWDGKSDSERVMTYERVL